MSLQLHKPDGKGGLQPVVERERDWRRQLKSSRWGAALSGGKLPELKNPEMDPTPPGRSVALWLGLAVLTFVILVAGYGTGFWSLVR